MKLSFRTTTLIAAICTTVYVVLCWLFHDYGWAIFEGHILRWQYAMKPFQWLAIASIVLILATATRSRITIPKSNLILRILSGIYIAIILSIVTAIIHSWYYGHGPTVFWREDRWYAAMYRYAYFYGLRYLVPATLWGLYIFYDKLGFKTNSSNPQQRKTLSVITWLIGGTLTFSVLCDCIYLIFATTWTPLQIPEWSYLLPYWKVEGLLRFVTYIALIYWFVHVLFPELDTINQSRNTHCAPDSKNEQRFKFNRTLTLASIGTMIFSGLLSSYMMHYKRPIINDLIGSDIVNSVEAIAVSIAVICLILSWIMLNKMAITQLPNPRGYKIYNLVCHLLIQICIICGMVIGIYQDSGTHPSLIHDICAHMLSYTFLAFFITQTIRVITYTLPNKFPQSDCSLR